MSIIEELLYNKCSYCLDHDIKHGNYIDIEWRDEKNEGYWPMPYQESGFNPERVKAIVVGQDPTIENPRPMKYVLEANLVESNLGKFVREMFGGLKNIRFDEIYITNLIKCRFREKPGKDNRNICRFIDCMASECYSRFLSREIAQCRNARYLFTLGRDNFEVLAGLFSIDHPPLTLFKEFYGTKFVLRSQEVGRNLYLIPLPHQPTYDLAKRFSPYSEDEVRRRLSNLYNFMVEGQCYEVLAYKAVTTLMAKGVDMAQKGYQTNLASEFYVISTLFRLGYDASLTLGNKKAVDITIVHTEGNATTIDVKAVAGKMDWLLGNSPPHQAQNHYVVLLSFEGKFSEVENVPRVWVFPSEKLTSYIKVASNNSTHYVSRKSVLETGSQFESAWQLIKGGSPK